MKSITFVNLPSPFVENQLWIYPLGILNIATYTRSLGYEVDLLDLAKYQDQIEDQISRIKTDCVGVSAVTPQYDLLAKIPKMTGKRLIAGGIHPTLFPREVLSLGYHAVIQGEGEPNIEKAMRCDGVFSSDQIVDLNTLPFVDRSLFSGYQGPAPVMAGRGCPYKCAFCARVDGLSKTRFRDPAIVVQELWTLDKQDVIFYDDTFTMKKSWLTAFCNEIKETGLRMRFRCSTRADKLSDDVAEMLVKAGFVEVCIGVESGSQAILDGIGKKTLVADNSKALETCRKHGLRVKAFIMLGCPRETGETIQETYDWIQVNRPDKIGLYMLNPLPGSDIYDHPEKYDLKMHRGHYSENFYGGRRESMESQVSTSGLTKEEITVWYRRFLTDFKEMLV